MERIRISGRGAGPLWVAAALALAPAALAADFQQSVPAEPGGSLRLRLDLGSVEVESHAEDAVRVDAHASGAGARRLAFELRGDGHEVELVGRQEGWDFWTGLLGGPRVRVRVRVPEEFSVDIETAGGTVDVERLEGAIGARTSGGSIRVEGAQGEVELRTSGGSIRAEGVEGDLRAQTSGGSIRVFEVEGAVEARTSGGEIVLRDVRGPVTAVTSGGSIRARFSEDPEGSLETSGGNIEVEFDESAQVDLDARTSGGRVEVEHPIRVAGEREPDHVVGEINGGGGELRLRTSGGNIRVRIE